MAKCFVKTLIKPKTYCSPDGDLIVTNKRIKHWRDGFAQVQKSDLPYVSMGWDHTNQILPLSKAEFARTVSAKETVGHLKSYKILPDDQGAEVTVEITDPVAIGRVERNEVYLSPVIVDEFRNGDGLHLKDFIGRIDLVNHPVDNSQTPFRNVDAQGVLACALRMGLDTKVYRMADDEFPPKKDDEAADDSKANKGDDKPDENPDAPTVEEEGNKTLEAILAHLVEQGIPLASDTTSENLEERLLGALLVKNALDKKAKEEEAADKDDDAAETENKDKPMVSDPGFAAMSLEHKAILQHATRQHRETVSAKLHKLLEAGRCTPAEFKQRSEAVGAVRLSLDSAGAPSVSDLEKWIESREAVPNGTFWDASKRTRMSTVVEPPAGFVEEAELTAEQAEARARQMHGAKPAAAK